VSDVTGIYVFAATAIALVVTGVVIGIIAVVSCPWP